MIQTSFGPRRRSPPWHVAVVLRSRSPSWPMDQAAQAVVEALDRADCLVRVVTVTRAAFRVEEFLRDLRRSGVDGVIDLELTWFLPRPNRLRLWEFPLVAANGLPPFARADSVGVDEDAVASWMLDHFQSLGHRRCGYIITSEFPHAVERLKAFEKEARRRGIWDPSLLLDLRTKMAREPYQTLDLRRFPVVKRFFDHQPKPLAMWSHNDFVSAALIEWLLEAGCHVPRDVAVAGVDNHALYALANVPLTTAALPFAALGRESVRLLLRRLAGSRSVRCSRVLLPAPVIIRESTVGRPEDREWLNTVMRLMREHLCESALGRKVAGQLGWRGDVLAQRFRRAMGCTLLEYRDQLRLKQARQRMRDDPKAKIEAIAREIGFSSASRFAAAFRQRFGANPAEFRDGVQRNRPICAKAAR